MKWMYNRKGELAGIALGSDACAEHEWGTEDMRRSFGLLSEDAADGIERRLIRKEHKGLTFTKEKKRDYLFFIPEDFYRQPGWWVNESELKRWGDEAIIAAWDSKSFGIIAYDDASRANLKKLHEAFLAKDVAFWTSIGVFHTGGGLIFVIASKVDEEDKKLLLDNDLDVKALKVAAKETGIEAALEKAGRSYLALSPRWAKEHNKTKYKVIFWLNPRDQDKYNYGWFTVEELQEWVQEKGPIIGGRNAKKERR